MSRESQGLAVGSKMRIKLTKKNEGVVDPDASNNHDGDHPGGGASEDSSEEELVKKEVVQEQIYNGPTPSEEQRLIKSGEDNLTLGKRLRKPKEVPYEFCFLSRKKKKKTNKPYVPKSESAGYDHSGKSISCKGEKTASDRLRSPVQAKTPTMFRAEEIQSSLGSEFPSFAKLLVRSHVSSCFWMGLPMQFCKSNLPREDTAVILEDESGEYFELTYIAEKTGLSRGWRKFATGHNLLEGDVLIFQLLEPCKFKVYVVRANNLNEVDGALSLLNLDAQTKQNDTEKDDAENSGITLKNIKRKRLKSLPLAVVQNKKKKSGLPKSAPTPVQTVDDQFENDSEEAASEVFAGPKFSGSAVRFRDIKSFEDFNVLVDGLCIDSELPEHIRVKYYEICCSKNAFIHTRLLRGLNYKLVAGVVCETVNIADAIKACKLTTSRDEFATWEKTLKSFEFMGMNVGFLRARVRRLVSLAFESEGTMDNMRYMEAKTGRLQVEDEMRNLEAKLVELKEASGKFGADIEALKSKAERYERSFQEEVDAPW